MHPIEKWHQIVKTKDISLYDKFLSEDVVFYSPVVFTPQKGKDLTKAYLMAAGGVFSDKRESSEEESKTDSAFKYTKEVIGEKSAMLEFESELNGKYVNGIDLISWNEEGKITEFKVFIRPLQAVNALHEMMGKMLERMKS
tara:strand:- start:3170 stop:3592 length:423 start_codon:yes stop_codon:yes gene_type:complete